MGAKPLESLALSVVVLAVLFGVAWIVLRKTTCVRMRMMVLGVIVAVMASVTPVEIVSTSNTTVTGHVGGAVITTRSGLSRIGFLLVLGGVFATVAQKREEKETADA